MSYHEYTGPDGKLRRQHNNGHRQTSQARAMIATINQIYDEAHPDSKLWQNQAEFTLVELADLLGREQSKAWSELVWPGDKIDNYTWKEICEMAESAYCKALLGERDIKELATRSKLAQEAENV